MQGEARFIEEDFVLAFSALRTRASRVSVFVACATLLVVSVLLLGRQVWLSGFAAAVAVVFGFLGIWHSAGPRYLARRHMRGLAEDEAAVRFRFDQEGMTLGGSWGTSFYRYQGIHAYFEYPSAILVQTGPIVRMVVPNRAFSAEDLAVVRGLLASRVRPRTGSSGEPENGLVWRHVALWIALLLLVLVASGVIDLGAAR